MAFIVYDRAVAANTVPAVDESRSAKLFASVQDRVDDLIPSDAPGWIVQQYERLVNSCDAEPDGTVAPVAPEGTTEGTAIPEATP